jgi:hypothetical protein
LPSSKELGGTGFPACAKNTLLFWAVGFNYIFQIIIAFSNNYRIFQNVDE